jgi:hypothetical protein
MAFLAALLEYRQNVFGKRHRRLSGCGSQCGSEQEPGENGTETHENPFASVYEDVEQRILPEAGVPVDFSPNLLER